MSSSLDRIAASAKGNRSVLFSAAAVGLSAVVVAFGVGTVAQSLLVPSISADEADPLEGLRAESTDFLETSKKRFEGRSMYSLPPRPVPKQRIVEVPKPPEPPKVDLGPPPPPATYTGPAPTSVLGETVFFSSLSDEDKRIRVGETKSGITVIAVNAPYSVKLGYQRGEYTVPLWAKADDRLFRGDVAPARVNGIVTAGGSGTNSTDGGRTGGSSTAGNSTGSLSGSGASRAGAGSTRPGGSPNAGLPGGDALGSPMRGSPTRAGGNGSDLPPGDQPGGDQPSGPGPEGEPQELPSQAMEPQRLNPQGGQEDAPPPEYVDRELLPPRLTQDQIASMTEAQAREALAAIDATEGWTVDDHSRARLDYERDLLRQRLQPRR